MDWRPICLRSRVILRAIALEGFNAFRAFVFTKPTTRQNVTSHIDPVFYRYALVHSYVGQSKVYQSLLAATTRRQLSDFDVVGEDMVSIGIWTLIKQTHIIIQSMSIIVDTIKDSDFIVHL